VWAELIEVGGQTNGRADRHKEFIMGFRNFAKAPEKAINNFGQNKTLKLTF